MPSPSESHPGFTARVRTGEHAAVPDDAVLTTVRCEHCGAFIETIDPDERFTFFQEHRHGTEPIPNGTQLG